MSQSKTYLVRGELSGIRDLGTLVSKHSIRACSVRDVLRGLKELKPSLFNFELNGDGFNPLNPIDVNTRLSKHSLRTYSVSDELRD
jgi:hypothetical protein